MPLVNENVLKIEQHIRERYPNKELLTQSDVANYCGVDKHTVVKLFKFTNHFISIHSLAKAINEKY